MKKAAAALSVAAPTPFSLPPQLSAAPRTKRIFPAAERSRIFDDKIRRAPRIMRARWQPVRPRESGPLKTVS